MNKFSLMRDNQMIKRRIKVLLSAIYRATPSNCGEVLIAFTTKCLWLHKHGRAKCPGYGKNVKDWTIRNQVLFEYAVHRLNVGG
jgi:hypothetical protein